MNNNRPEQLPLARTDQLIVKEVDDEVLVYDLANDKAHCLKKTAALVWKNCDGEKSISEINSAVSHSAHAPVNDAVVWMALDELQKFNLMERAPTAEKVFAGMSRRQILRTIGLGAVALPVVVSIVAPLAANAATPPCVPNGGSCTIGVSVCCSSNKTCTAGTPPTCK